MRRFGREQHSAFVSFHRRRLPHHYPADQALFVTWHLHGSLPSPASPPGKLPSGQAFAWVDRHLDAAQRGPAYLRQPAIAQLVVDSIRRGVELSHYDLHAFVVMPNHVHVLLNPLGAEPG